MVWHIESNEGPLQWYAYVYILCNNQKKYIYVNNIHHINNRKYPKIHNIIFEHIQIITIYDQQIYHHLLQHLYHPANNIYKYTNTATKYINRYIHIMNRKHNKLFCDIITFIIWYLCGVLCNTSILIHFHMVCICTYMYKNISK